MCGFCSITSLHHRIFYVSVQEIASCHRDQFAHGVKIINTSFEEFKRKTIFFVLQWLKQKELEKLCEIFEN